MENKKKELETLKAELNEMIKTSGGLRASVEDQKKVIELGRKIEVLEAEINGAK